MPETSFKILLGNLIKNAFACTEQGQITVAVDQDSIRVTDTGIGLDSKPRGVEGFGLGLLIAHDICRKYDWHLELINNDRGGCTARINLHPEPEDLQNSI
jgi:signal transduction histidine kinase